MPPPSSVKSTVDMYDYKTRQRKKYNCPSGLVEKMNFKNEVCTDTSFLQVNIVKK